MTENQPSNDKTLIQNICIGNKKAFTELYQLYQPMVLRYCGRILNHDIEAAADIADEVFFDVWQKAGNYRGESSVKNWIFSIAHNKTVDYIRKNKETLLENPEQMNSIIDHQETPEQSLVNSMHADMIQKLLGQLSVEHREVLHMFYYMELKTKDIAHALDIQEATIRTRLHYAKKAFQSILKSANIKKDVLFKE